MSVANDVKAPVAEDLSRETLLKMHQPRFEMEYLTFMRIKLLVCCAPNLFLDLFAFYTTDLANRFYYFTQLGVMLVTVS